LSSILAWTADPWFALNFDVQYQLEAETVEPYVGGGISWARLSPDVGLNVKGGVSFNPASRTHPYVEAVLNFADGSEAPIFKAGFLIYGRRVALHFHRRKTPGG
jgi:hypothetical protein